MLLVEISMAVSPEFIKMFYEVNKTLDSSVSRKSGFEQAAQLLVIIEL